jgi:alanine racemase
VARASAHIDLGAITANAATLRASLDRGVELCAVVKADAYGHGAVPSACAALRGGADRLAVVSGREALDLRVAGVDAPLLVLGALDDAELEMALEADADVSAWTPEFAACLRGRPDARVHVKLDTGLGRLGTRNSAAADRVVRMLGDRVVGLWTHLATADDLGPDGSAFCDEQLTRFRAWALPHRTRRPSLRLHAANSAAALARADAHFDMVRCGIALYGVDPFGVGPERHGLRPALSLRSHVAAVKPCAAGESVGYGRTFVAQRATRVATIPLGYGDGWRRSLSNNADVVIRGRRHPLVGTVSMDNVTADLGSGSDVRVGDEAVLLGAGITAEEVARRAGTIANEVTTGLLPRTERVYEASDDRRRRPGVVAWGSPRAITSSRTVAGSRNRSP